MMSWLGLGVFALGFIVSAATDGEAGAVAGVLMFAGFLIGVYGLFTRKRAAKASGGGKGTSVQSLQAQALAQQQQHAADVAQAEANAKAAAEQRRRDAIARAHQRANSSDDIEWG